MIKITTNGGKLKNEYKVAIDPLLSMVHPGKIKLRIYEKIITCIIGITNWVYNIQTNSIS